MGLDEYLEKVDNGETVTVTNMYQDGDYEAVLDAIEYGKTSGASLKVDRDDADDIMDRDLASLGKAVLENTITTTLEQVYDRGMEAGTDVNYNGSNEHQLKDKADKKNKKKKASEIGLGISSLGALAGLNLNSTHLIGASATAGLLSAAGVARYGGMEDGVTKEAAEGLEDAYGGYELAIN
jgi:hypothetical protein